MANDLLTVIKAIQGRLVDPRIFQPKPDPQAIDITPGAQQIFDQRVLQEHLTGIASGNGDVLLVERTLAHNYIVAQNAVTLKMAEAAGHLDEAQRVFILGAGKVALAKKIHQQIEAQTPGATTLAKVLGDLETYLAQQPKETVAKENELALKDALEIIVIEAAAELSKIRNEGSATMYSMAKDELQEASATEIESVIHYAFANLQKDEDRDVVFNPLTQGVFNGVSLAEFTENVIERAGIVSKEERETKERDEHTNAQGAALNFLYESFYKYLRVVARTQPIKTSRPDLEEGTVRKAAKEFLRVVAQKDSKIFNRHTTSEELVTKYGGVLIPTNAQDFADFLVNLLRAKRGFPKAPESVLATT